MTLAGATKTAAATTFMTVAMALAACGGGAGTETAATGEPGTTVTTATSPKQEKFPAEVRSGFLDACTERADKKRCRCALDYLDKTATVEELAAAGLEVTGKKTPKLLEKAVAKCA